MKNLRIGILTGGGDCAGLNPAVKWVVKTALDERLKHEKNVKCEVVGISEGWRGLVDVDPGQPMPNEWLTPLNDDVVRTWDRYGGTNLGTSRTNPYNPKNGKSKLVISNIEKLGLDVIIAIGGEDTLGVAGKLSKDGVNVIGIPKTIDKDLWGTDYTLGFETAVEVIVSEVDRLRSTAGSHRRVFVIESMGRHAGWLTLIGGESSGASVILIPEHDFNMDKVNELVVEGRQRGAKYDILMVSEGAKVAGSTEMLKGQAVDAFGHITLGGLGTFVADEIEKSTKIETRSVILGHLQRAGVPCAFDRRMGRYFGMTAMDLVLKNDFGKMVSYLDSRITAIPIEEIIGKLSLVDVDKLYDVEKYTGKRSTLGDKRS